MQSESSKGFSKLHWVFMYSIWVLAELTSIAAVAYSIYSVIILILGNLAGAAVFAGIIPGFIMSFVFLYLCMLTRIPWHAGDYQLDINHEYQVRQVRPFHSILWSKEKSEVLPHLDINPYSTDPVGEKDGSIVYCIRGVDGFAFEGRKRWLAYAWAILCETFVLAVLLLSMWFMVWAGGAGWRSCWLRSGRWFEPQPSHLLNNYGLKFAAGFPGLLQRSRKKTPRGHEIPRYETTGARVARI